MNDRFDIVGKFIVFETKDGVTREGKVTGLESYTFDVNSEEFRVIIGFQLNDDYLDKLFMSQCRRLQIS